MKNLITTDVAFCYYYCYLNTFLQLICFPADDLYDISLFYSFFCKNFPPLKWSFFVAFNSCSQGELSVGAMASFIGYTFILTYGVSKLSCWLVISIFFFFYLLFAVWCYFTQVQGLVNTFGDLRGALAAVDRINSVLSGVQVDDALAYGLERELKQKAVDDENYKLFFSNSSTEKNQKKYLHYMSALKTSSNLFSLAWSGDVCLEGIFIAIFFISIVLF